jgi:hypothetical protein
MSTLKHLDLAYCPVTDSTLAIMPFADAVLRTLVLARSCDNVWSNGLWTPRGVRELQESLPKLQVVMRLWVKGNIQLVCRFVLAKSTCSHDTLVFHHISGSHHNCLEAERCATRINGNLDYCNIAGTNQNKFAVKLVKKDCMLSCSKTLLYFVHTVCFSHKTPLYEFEMNRLFQVWCLLVESNFLISHKIVRRLWRFRQFFSVSEFKCSNGCHSTNVAIDNMHPTVFSLNSARKLAFIVKLVIHRLWHSVLVLELLHLHRKC